MATKKVYKQVGKTKRSADKQRKAKKVGWRKSSETGESYFENRRNRSDADKTKKLKKGGFVSFNKRFKV